MSSIFVFDSLDQTENGGKDGDFTKSHAAMMGDNNVHVDKVHWIEEYL